MSWFLGDAGNTKPRARCSQQMIAGPVKSSRCASPVQQNQDEDGTRATKRMHVLEARVEESERMLRELYSKRQDVDVNKSSPVEPDLLVAKSGRELDYNAEKIHTFNKINMSRDSPLTWGKDVKFKRVKCVRSLRLWLQTPMAAEYGLDESYEEDFQVFQNGGILHTLNGDFRGGVGVFSLWIPSRKHSALTSSHWASLWHVENDPRTQYADPVTGKAWVAGVHNKAV